MSIQRFESNGRYHKAVIHNGILYISGQACGGDGGIKEQTAETLALCEDILNQYGSDKQHILMTNVYITDAAHFDEMNEVYDAWVSQGHQSCRACTVSQLVEPDLLIEITMTAAIKQHSAIILKGKPQ